MPLRPGSLPSTTFRPDMYGPYDPSGVIGSAATINKAIAAAAAAGRGDVDLGYGDYTLETLLNLSVGNNVRVWGHGKNATRLKLAPNGTYSAGVIVSSPLLTGNSLQDFSLDCNGAGGAVIGSQKPIIVASSRSRINIELCNWVGTVGSGTGANISGTVGISVAGHDVDLSETYLHDTYRWQILTTSAIGASGATTAAVSSVTGLTYASGSNGNQTLVIDPSVNAMTSTPLTSGTTPTITPITDNDNPRPGTGMTTGMTGIYVGQQLTLGSGGTTEPVTVASITASGFMPSAPLTNSYAAGAPISYTGATETVQLGAAPSGSTITFATATQLTHAGNVAIVAYAPTYDAIAVVGWTLGNLYAEDIRYLHGKAERLGEDAIGLAVGRRITVGDFHALDCSCGGFALTDHVSGDIHDFIINNTFNGQFPSSIASPGQIWSGIYVIGGSAPATAGTQPSSWDGLRIHHGEINGHSRGVVVAGTTANPIRDVDVDHVRLNGQGVEPIYLSGCKQVNVDHCKIRNPNSYSLANDTGLPVAGILVVGTSTATVDDASFGDNDIVDDRGGSAKMHAGYMLYGSSSAQSYATHIRIRGGRVSGFTQAAAEFSQMQAGSYSIKDVDGYNPLSAPTAPATTLTNTTWQQNTTGVDCFVQVTQSGVTGTHLYVNGTNSTTGARDYGAQSAWPAMVFVPANAWIRADFTAGTVTIGWQGT